MDPTLIWQFQSIDSALSNVSTWSHLLKHNTRSGGEKVKFQFFSFLFDENSTKIYEKVTNTHEKVTNIYEKLTKFRLSWFFSSLLIKEEEIWVISRIQFRVLWVWLGARKSKTDNVAINFPSLGSQRKRIYSFWPMELWAVQLSKKHLIFKHPVYVSLPKKCSCEFICISI